MIKITAQTRGLSRSAHLYKDGFYRCFPRSENRKRFAKSFRTPAEAAAFLVLNGSWGIRVTEGYAIIYRDLSVARP